MQTHLVVYMYGNMDELRRPMVHIQQAQTKHNDELIDLIFKLRCLHCVNVKLHLSTCMHNYMYPTNDLQNEQF